MANFHTNNVGISANNDDMLAVLRAMAFNLATNSNVTGYTDLLDDAVDAPHAYSRVRMAIDEWYWFAFTPGSVGSDEWMANHPDYQERELANNPSYAALAEAVKNFASENSGVSVSMGIAPSGRPLSETATVSMDRFGQTFVLRISYSTANNSNREDVCCLFQMLPKGKYGLAFLDADEYDGYDMIEIFSALSSGGSSGSGFDNQTFDVERAAQIYEDAKGIARTDLSACDDLEEAAVSFAICKWSEFSSVIGDGRGLNGDGRDLYSAIDIVKSASDHQPLNPGFGSKARIGVYGLAGVPDSAGMKGSESIEAMPPEAIRRIRGNVEPLLRRFPFECEVTGQGYQGRNANIEHLVPGAAVRLESDWKTQHFNVVGIAVYDSKGRRLANLGGYLNPSDIDRITIACLLPYIKATAIDVSPLGAAVDGRRKQGQFALHLEVVPIDLPSVLEEVRDLLSSDIEDRTRSSIMPE